MYKLLIVDDEDWIRERLRDTIDWNSLNIHVTGEARDGEEALELTEKLLPDIVITDIRMPCIDGLEYIKRLRDNNNRSKVVIISGYSDFDYAQKAVKLGAFDYILKPVEDDELINVVKRCLVEIDAEKSRDIIFKKAEGQLKESQPLLEKEFYINLVNGNFGSEEDMVMELEHLGLNCCGRSNICFIVELDEYVEANLDKEWDRRSIQFVMCNIARDFLNKLGSSKIFYTRTGEVVCLVFSETDEKVLTRQVLSVSNGIRKIIKRITGHSVTIGIGRTCSSLTGISTSYKEAGEALQYKAYLGWDRVYDIRSIDMQHRPGYYKANDLEALINNIKMGNRENALSALDNIMKTAYKGNENIRPIDLKLLYMDIINSVFKAALDTNTAFDDLSELSFKFFEQLNRLQTMDEIYRWLEDTIGKTIDVLEKYKNSRKRKVIERAVEYINKHYSEPITLNIISEKFFMNASYFCKVFKEEMGESFTKYLINLRIQKAKELMNDPTIRIYEIAAMVGYEDVQYFTKIFKSIQGVTPMQYREKIK